MGITYKQIEGGILAPVGFKAAGVYCGIKQDSTRGDLSMIVCEKDAVAAGVFTTNAVKAHCVLLNQETIKNETARAIVVNAGNANACNGPQGMVDAKTMCSLTAQALGTTQDAVFCASTGVIGHALPMDKVASGIESAAAALHGGSCSDVTRAIMTTDTRPKEIAVEIMLGDKAVRIGGIAKGAGMIEPNMATMLGFLTTDVVIGKSLLQKMLKRVAAKSFNAITVDGDTSTNDMVLILASGLAGNAPLVEASEEAHAFEAALAHVCTYLAKEIARDGEGATKFVEIVVRGSADPMKVAKTIANSPLVKTAIFGNDPNWGRILAAAGRSGVAFDPTLATVMLAGETVFANGQPTAFDPAALSATMKGLTELTIRVDLGDGGEEEASVWTCDFSYDYVKINADYHT
ncbi:MAG: bifunctional glutamate N-acetyltransferase/amino-acid acetyltransferase ArgJ [Alphaproteobacteria bacterium]|nr:bifunctional glutamate N-acetyltransferase/amino-acid acetyltransferase ArgJ [Alphaproteobacteria bacterium]